MKKHYSFSKLLLRKQEYSTDKLIFILMVVLVVFGVLMVADASGIRAESHFGDKLFFAKQQGLAVILGLASFLTASIIPVRWWHKMSIPLFLVAIILLTAVLIPGIGVQTLGARRWINLSGFTFQPGEIMKLAMVLYLARLFEKKTINILHFFFITVFVAGLIIIEPDFGTATIIAGVAFTMFFMSGAPLRFFVAVFPILVAVVGLVIWFSPYRRARLLSFFSTSQNDPLGSSYHISQALLALSSGGLFGVGLGQARSKYLFLPEAANDSIFAVIAEELGFVGVTILLGIFVLLTLRIFRVSIATNDVFVKLTAAGIATWIGMQTFINVAAMTATVPITGVPLPFISYGGTALVVSMTALGIVFGISKQKEQVVYR